MSQLDNFVLTEGILRSSGMCENFRVNLVVVKFGCQPRGFVQEDELKDKNAQ